MLRKVVRFFILASIFLLFQSVANAECTVRSLLPPNYTANDYMPAMQKALRQCCARSDRQCRIAIKSEYYGIREETPRRPECRLSYHLPDNFEPRDLSAARTKAYESCCKYVVGNACDEQLYQEEAALLQRARQNSAARRSRYGPDIFSDFSFSRYTTVAIYCGRRHRDIGLEYAKCLVELNKYLRDKF